MKFNYLYITLIFTGIVAGCADDDTSQPQAPLITAAAPPLEWVKVTGGCFDMGDNHSYPEEGPARNVCVDDFYITKTEVTNAQFAAFVRATDYKTRAEKGWPKGTLSGVDEDIKPASAVFVPPQDNTKTWWQLVGGANWRRPNGTGHAAAAAPDYPVVHDTKEDAENFANWVQHEHAAWSHVGLPSEAQWEYAARKGQGAEVLDWDSAEAFAQDGKANIWQGVFPHIDKGQDGYAGLAPVASFPPNHIGAFDMIGNVWEWTASPYTANHSDRARERAGPTGFDPRQPGLDVGVIKGGSYLCARSYCYRFRPAARQAQDLAFGASHIGFRLIRS